VAATNSACVVDWATLNDLQEDQETSEEPKNWQVPEFDFRLTRHPAKDHVWFEDRWMVASLCDE
jgi:hypothetical protein